MKDFYYPFSFRLDGHLCNDVSSGYAELLFVHYAW